jgi:23S rRNA pseudouridine1911/1915/1917 synthase
MRPAAAQPNPAARTFVADRGDEGQRLDVVLTRHLADIRGVTRTRVQRWVEDGKVRVRGRVTTRSARPLHAGDEVEIDLPWRRERVDHTPEPIALEVIHEDEHLLAVSKPAGMLVHPTGRHRTGTLFNALLWRARSWESGARPGLIHRLDRDTSGVIVVAKSRVVHARTVRLLRSARARKRYLAVVCGSPPADGVIRVPLARVSDSPPRMGPAAEGGLSCETRYEVLARGVGGPAGVALLACDLITGRLHQIRAHLRAAGWPILGDPVYGPTEAEELPDAVRDGIGRQALHAWRLTMPHPVTGEPLDLTAPVPDDMRRLLDAGFPQGVPERVDSD